MEQQERQGSTGQGYLIVHVTTARGAIPLEGVQVLVRNYLPDGADRRGDVIATLTSGRDGNTPRLPLSAPPRSNSLSPSTSPPYQPYLIEVNAQGYFAQRYINVPIFDGIVAIQFALERYLMVFAIKGYAEKVVLGYVYGNVAAKPYVINACLLLLNDLFKVLCGLA